MKTDALIETIETFLTPEFSHLQSWEELILEAVAHHMADLMSQAPIPYPQMDYVQEHLMEDAWDILRKLTYGSSSLRDYRNNAWAKSLASKSKRS